MKQTIILFALIIATVGILSAQVQTKAYHFKYKKGKYQLVDPNNKKVKVDPFSYASEFSEGLALVEKDLKFGYIDSTGQMIIDFQFYDAGDFHDGLAQVSLGDKYGYINKKGEWMIKPQFQMAQEFRGNFAKVLKDNPDTTRFGKSFNVVAIINRKGEILGNKYFSSFYKNDDEGLFKARIRDSIFHVTFDGQVSFHKLKNREKNEIKKEGVMPQYPGGEAGLRQYIASSVRYPLSAQEHGLKARCYISFVVDQQGNVTEVYPANYTFPILMKEGVRTVKEMSQWKPGFQNGKAVKVSYTVPINFILN